MSELYEHYKITDIDDRGANGYVLFAKNRVSNQDVAIKFYFGEAGEQRHDEPRLLAQVTSPHVLKILDARVVSDKWAYFVTPRCAGGDLDDYLATRPSAHKGIDVAIGVCAGISAIQAAGMVHRDIKAANVVLEEGKPLIADFGSVRMMQGPDGVAPASHHSVLITPPESFEDGVYVRSSDLYQIGLLTFQLLGGRLPYDPLHYLEKPEVTAYAQNQDPVFRSQLVDAAVRRRVARGTLLDHATLPPWINRGTKAVLRRMTDPEVSKRFGNISEAAAALTNARSKITDWRRTDVGAALDQARRSIALRPVEPGTLYQAYIVTASGARRAPGVSPGRLDALVRHFS